MGDRISDYLRFCLHGGIGGLVLLALSAAAALLVVMAAAVAAMWTLVGTKEGAQFVGRAFSDGWHKAKAAPPPEGDGAAEVRRPNEPN